ncbi:MAG: hypothetical protein R3275_12695 [Saprospiraceae bacterium]|nr:hypothetical protein [Saprospiraceae bacterium]
MDKKQFPNVMNIVLITILVVFFISVFVIERVIEKKLTNYLDDSILEGEFIPDYTLVTNQLTLNYRDRLRINNPKWGELKVVNARLDVSGFNYFKFQKERSIDIGTVAIRGDSVELELRSDSRDTSVRSTLFNEIDRVEILSSHVGVTTDSFSFRIDSADMGIAGIRNQGDTILYFALDYLEGRQLDVTCEHTYQINAQRISTSRINDELNFYHLSYTEEPRNKANRVIIGAASEMATIEGVFEDRFVHDRLPNHLHITGLNLEIDLVDERPFCDGHQPCLKPVITEVLHQFPFRDSITATGQLKFRYFEFGELQSTLFVNHFYTILTRDLEDSIKVVDADVRAQVNNGIDLVLEGVFREDDHFNYKMCSAPFSMITLNPFIPSQSGYKVMVEKGECSGLCLIVDGHERTSTAVFNIKYEDLKLDLTAREGIGDDLLRTAMPVLINKNADSNGEIVHEYTLPPHRPFFHQMGQHVNHGFKEAVVKRWIRKKE